MPCAFSAKTSVNSVFDDKKLFVYVGGRDMNDEEVSTLLAVRSEGKKSPDRICTYREATTDVTKAVGVGISEISEIRALLPLSVARSCQ